MSTLTSLARAVAAEHGIAQPAATVRHVHVSDHPLAFIPLALAGEANAPLAAMVGTDPSAPALLVVAEPRNRDERFAWAGRLARIAVAYIEGFQREEETVPAGRGGEERTRYAGAPQILVPNQAGITFTRLLGRSTRFRRTEGAWAVDPAVPVLGRWLSYLADRAEVPGSSMLLAMTDALARHWASGQSAAEDQNLAALTGWIDPDFVAPAAGRDGFAAAAAAEDPLRWPPAGPATDPTFDNEVLAPLIEAYRRAGGDEARRRRARLALEEALATQIEPTWRLVWRAVELLRALPPGRHVAQRWEADRDSFSRYASYLREGGAPQPRRDSAVLAARRLAWLEEEVTRYAAQRALDDPLAMAELRMTGEAFAGTVVAVEPGRVVAPPGSRGPGRRRVLRPLVTVATDDPVTLEAGTRLVCPSRPGQSGRLVSLSRPGGWPPAGPHGGPLPGRPHGGGLAGGPHGGWLAGGPHGGRLPDSPADSGLTLAVIELSGGMGHGLAAAPGSVPQAGERVCYAALPGRHRPWAELPPPEETPWTHGGPPVPYQPTDEDAAEEWS
jgi:hypothetical protein